METFDMWKERYRKLIGLFIFFSFFNYAGASQDIGIETEGIEALIDEWNFANNSRSLQSFENVYSEQLLFYTQNVSSRRAMELKQRLFREKPSFRQRIVSYITYTPYTAGVTKCEFTKEVMEKSGWKKYPSYLLVSYEDNRYKIVGESDYATDKTLGYKLEIGEPITFEKVAEKADTPLTESPDTTTTVIDEVPVVADEAEIMTDEAGITKEQSNTLSDSSLAVNTPHATVEADSSTARSKPDDISIFAPLSSLGVLKISKGYVFVLIGIFLLGALTIFIAGSVHNRKRKRGSGAQLQRSDEAEYVVQQFKLQSEFESFVITLFDPLYFRYRRPKTERVYAGKVTEAEIGPDLELEFNHKQTHARFAIKCLYYKGTSKSEVQLFSFDRQQTFRDYEEDSGMAIYYVLGFGGVPDDPKELYLVPAQEVRSEFVSKAALKPYSKSGMFFYNAGTGMLQ